MFQGSFKDILSKLKESVKGHVCFKKISKKVSRVFQECFDEILFCNMVVPWISLQLPEQKEGLFDLQRSGKGEQIEVCSSWLHYEQ